MEERAYGVLALAQLFRVRPDQKAELLELLAQARPKLAVDPQRQRLLDFERAGAALVRAYREGRISAMDLPPELLGLATAGEDRDRRRLARLTKKHPPNPIRRAGALGYPRSPRMTR